MCVPFCRSILKKIKKMATKQQKLKVLARGVKSGWFSSFLSMCMTIQIIFQQPEKRAVFWLESKSSDQHCFYFNVNVIILFCNNSIGLSYRRALGSKSLIVVDLIPMKDSLRENKHKLKRIQSFSYLSSV